MTEEPRTYLSPYAAGIGVGIALLAAFVVTGHGLGAMGGLSAGIAASTAAIAPEHVDGNLPYDAFVPFTEASGLSDWFLFQLLGLCLGAGLSAALSGRFRIAIVRGSSVDANRRLWAAFGGGVAMALGAKLARGCTSGQGLTGGATFSAGAWLFIACAFAGAYLLAPAFRRHWQS